MINQLTSGAIQYGVPMVVLLLPRVFSTTAEIPREEEEKGVRRKGVSKGSDERRGEMEEIEEKKGEGGEGGGEEAERGTRKRR